MEKRNKLYTLERPDGSLSLGDIRAGQVGQDQLLRNYPLRHWQGYKVVECVVLKIREVPNGPVHR